MGQSRIAGFTLVELMIVIAIVAILLALGLPSFQGSMRSNRLATSTNELIASISLASSAARKGRGASVCATADGTACGTDWNQGWMVWADANGDGALSAGETVRHVQGHPLLNLTLLAGAGAIAFNNRGGTAATAFTLKPSDCPATELLVNTLTVNASGQVKTAKSPCP